MKQKNAVLKSAVALALASMAAVASAGQFTGPTHPSDALIPVATQNFPVAAASHTAADRITFPCAQGAQCFDFVYTTGAGASGGFAVNTGGFVYMFIKFAGGTLETAGASVEVVAGPGNLLTVLPAQLSADRTVLMVPMRNDTGSTFTIGSGMETQFYLDADQFAVPGFGSAGATLTVTGALSATLSNPSGPFPSGADAFDTASDYTIARSDNAITASSANNDAGVRKIAVDAVNQRRRFVGSVLTNQIGSVSFADVAGTQYQADVNLGGYGKLDPTGRTVTMVVTAGSGSFNAGTLGAVYASNNADCSAPTHAGTLNAARTVATIPGIDAAGTNHYVCYSVGGTVQINEVKGITVAGTLEQPTEAGATNDQTVVVNGTLSNIVNDGTVIDLRNYVPNSAAAFGYASLIRVINTGNSAADVFAQFINVNGTEGTLGTVATGVAAGGVVELTPAQVEAVIGAPAAGVNPRLRISAPTSGLTVQLWMRSNGTWVDVTNAQTSRQNDTVQ
jgi:hypothetical protein